MYLESQLTCARQSGAYKATLFSKSALWQLNEYCCALEGAVVFRSGALG